MTKKNKRSVSNILVSALAGLVMMKAFVWVMETRVLKAKIDIPYLDYGIIGISILLILRVGFVLWRHKARQSTSIENNYSRRVTVNAQPTSELYSCCICGKNVSEKVRNYCLERTSKFNNKVFCFEHQK